MTIARKTGLKRKGSRLRPKGVRRGKRRVLGASKASIGCPKWLLCVP